MSNDRFLTAHVDLPFLEKLFREKPEDLSTTLGDEWPVVWQNVYRFLQLSAHIVVDADEQILREHETLAAFLLSGGFSRHVDFESGLSERYQDPESVEVDNHPKSVFLLESDDVPTASLRERTGLLFLDFGDLSVQWPQVLKGHSLNVLPEDRLPRGETPFEWKDLQVHANPLNALVIADKYVYQQFQSSVYRENLGRLLLTLLPDELDHPIHITLVTDLEASLENDFDPDDPRSWPHPKDIRKGMREHLEEHRPALDIRLGVVGYGGDGHKDRFIFTNYGLFTSNDSFSFFDDGDLNKETLVTYLPSSTHGRHVVEPRLKRMSKYLTTVANFDTGKYNHGPDKKILLADGDSKNRLLETVG